MYDIENFKTTEGFKVKAVNEINIQNMSQNEYKRISNTSATHFITVQLNQDFPIQDLNLELIKKIPGWVNNSTSLNDTDVKSQLDKTFGLNYLVKGISEAYELQNPNNQSYFNIKISIKK